MDSEQDVSLSVFREKTPILFWENTRFLLKQLSCLKPSGGRGSVLALCCQKIIDDFLKFRENLLTDLNWSVKRICGPSQGAKVIVNLQRFAE